MASTRRLQAIGGISVIGGGILLWFAYQPANLMCPHERVIEACNPNFFYLGPGIVFLFVGVGVLLFVYRRQSFGKSADAGR